MLGFNLRPHTNGRKTGQKWWDYYDQETMELTLEMYEMDFEVFGYERTIQQRPELVPPKKDRRIILESSKYQQFSRNSLIDTDGSRISQRDLFGSVRESVSNEAKSTRSRPLKQSLMEGNKDELLFALAGFRFSDVVEVDEDKLD